MEPGVVRNVNYNCKTYPQLASVFKMQQHSGFSYSIFFNNLLICTEQNPVFGHYISRCTIIPRTLGFVYLKGLSAYRFPINFIVSFVYEVHNSETSSLCPHVHIFQTT
jgi:hypothetical protein